MEVWILLAAAGSGYLLQSWQKSRACAIDDDESSIINRQGNTFPERRMRGALCDLWHACGCNVDLRNMYLVGAKSNDVEDQVLQGDVVRDACDCSTICKLDSQGLSLSNSCLAKCERSSTIYDRYSRADQCSSKCLEGVFDNETLSEGESSLCPDIPWPSYRATSHCVCDSQVESSCHNVERKGSCISRVFSAVENNKRGSIKRKNSYAVASLESCLWAQMDEEPGWTEAFGHSSNSYAGDRTVKAVASARRNGGFSLFLRRLRLRMPATRVWGFGESLATERATLGKGSLPFSFSPLRSHSRRWMKRARPYLGYSDGLHGSSFQGGANSLLKCLLFNFGLGVGMIFTILSDRLATKESKRPLQEVMGLLKDLEAEFRDGWKLSYQGSFSKEPDEEDIWKVQRAKTLGKLKSIMGLAEQARALLGDNLVPAPVVDPAQQKEMAKLEAELQAELERMEQSLNNGDTSGGCGRDLGSMECDAQVGTLIHGKLSARGIPCDVEVELHDEDGRDSLHRADTHLGDDHTVPPVELALRLHEVLEGRQQQHISELEAKVKHLNIRLQAKEDEVQYWKQRSLTPSPGLASDSCSSTKENGGTLQNSSFSSPGYSLPLSCEDYDEICNEFCQLWGDTGSYETPLAVSSQPHASPWDAYAQDRNLDWLCRGSSSQDDEHLSQSTSTGSIPCVMEFMGKQTEPCNPLEAYPSSNVESRHSTLTEKFQNSDWAGGQDLEAPVPCHDKLLCGAQDVIDIFEAHGQDGRALEWSLSEDSSYSSDVDEHMGQLLIKRIVEKSRRGSSLVEVAHSVMASFDGDGTVC